MSKVNEYLKRIKVLKVRVKSAKLTSLTAKQMKMYNEVEAAYKNRPNVYLSRKELQALVASDLEDRDNNHFLCLDSELPAISVSFPAGHLVDPNRDLNLDSFVPVL